MAGEETTNTNLDASRVSVGEAKVTGAIFVAPTTVPLPTDGTTSLNAAYKCLGYTSDSGLVVSESSSTKSLRVWEGQAEVRTIKNQRTEQIKFTPVECNEQVAKLTWGDDKVTVASGTGNLTIKHHGQTLDPVHIVIEMVPFAGAVQRSCAKVQLTERGDANYNGQDFSGRETTLNCLADASGVTMTDYICFTD